MTTIFKGTSIQHDAIGELPPAPPWRTFSGEIFKDRELKTSDDMLLKRGKTFKADTDEIELVNASLLLRRPLLVTGKPGTGKSSLAYAVAYELKLGPVLYWPITSRSTIQEGLYRYDAIGRVQDASADKGWTPEVGRYVRLGPLGTALLPARRPRVLLIDEIDKSDIDLPNNLLNVLEEGEFEIPELSRLPEGMDCVEVFPHDGNDQMTVVRGRVVCKEFPFIVLTSNGEREFPPPFLRRCLRLQIEPPNPVKLAQIVQVHFAKAANGKDGQALMQNDEVIAKTDEMIKVFLSHREKGDLATDQLLNALHLIVRGLDPFGGNQDKLIKALLKHLTSTDMK